MNVLKGLGDSPALQSGVFQLSILIRSYRQLARALLVAVGVVSWPHVLVAGTVDKAHSAVSRYMTVEDVYQLALSGKLHLIDIRRPSEWRATGVPRAATPATMHQDVASFLRTLRRVTSQAPHLPVAFICAHGHRSKYMQKILASYGYPNIIDVGEGMLGSRSGPGWLKTGLPTMKWTPAATQ